MTRRAEDAGFLAVDVRVTLRATPAAAQPVRPDMGDRAVLIRPWRDADLADLRRIAGSSHQTTRFYVDRNFPRDRCGALYETWIERSCGGEADMVLVAAVGDSAVGYVTCLRPSGPGDAGQIGLLGVAEAARGSGVGFRLVAAALDWFAHAQVGDVTVVTQERNLAALRLYERCGFVSHCRQRWYHKWYRPTPGEP
jgi:dTDP-4-amino-4,6-dideoxy-D-galactose acyltransferase